MKPSINDIKILKPSYVPVMCPVCRGHRTVNWGKERCGVCGGLGYLKIPTEEGEEYGYKHR
jgi:DnaJ-class molecular chaperone